MQLGSSMRRSRKTTAAERNRRHSEIAPVFLNENVRGDFRRAKEGMLRVVDAHGLRNAGLVFVAWFNFPAFLQFAQRKAIRRVAIDLVRGCKDEWRLRRKLSCGFQQIQRAIRVDSKIGLRIARCPVV